MGNHGANQNQSGPRPTSPSASQANSAKEEAPSAAIAKVPTHDIIQAGDIGANPFPLAIHSLQDPDMPEGAVILGKDPWTDYLKIDEGTYFTGEVVAVVKRFELNEETKVMEPRVLLVLRTTRKEQTCQRKFDATKGEKPRGKLVEEKVEGIKKTYDVYDVPVGTLVATNLRTIMKPVIPLARGLQARELFVKVTDRVASKRNAKQSYWNMKLATLPLPYERDSSIDHLSRQAEEMNGNPSGDADDSDIPFLGSLCPDRSLSRAI